MHQEKNLERFANATEKFLNVKIQNIEIQNIKIQKSPHRNRTPVSRVTGGDTYHYTTEDNIFKNYAYQ